MRAIEIIYNTFYFLLFSLVLVLFVYEYSQNKLQINSNNSTKHFLLKELNDILKLLIRTSPVKLLSSSNSNESLILNTSQIDNDYDYHEHKSRINIREIRLPNNESIYFYINDKLYISINENKTIVGFDCSHPGKCIPIL